MDEAYTRARDIIEKHNDKINQMADLLLEKETIYAEDIEPILGRAAQSQLKSEENLDNNTQTTSSHQGVTVAD